MKDYEKNIFLNCPFDPKYSDLFEALLFTILICGLNPRCSLEYDDGSKNRLNAIKEIINDCKYGFHDISRTELDEDNNLPRFNMPLELGLYLGAKSYGSSRNKEKVTIIFDKENYRYQKFISDIAGIDIKAHENDPKILIKNLRNILNTNINDNLKGSNYIVKNYEEYEKLKPVIISELELDNELEYADKLNIISRFLVIFSASAIST